MLNYSCANSFLFNRIHWLLVGHNITLLYLLSNTDVIIEQFTLKIINLCSYIFTEATSSVASMEATLLLCIVQDASVVSMEATLLLCIVQD